MKFVTVKTKDVRKFTQSIDDQLHRPHGTEGMEVLWGHPGTGKTTVVSYLVNVYDAIYIRALGCSTVTSILGDLCTELGGKRKCRRTDMVDFIVEELLRDKPRPIFVDEADYCFRQFEMIDSLRDIYDLSKCPVVLVGMENIARDIRSHERIARRITKWVEFKGLDLEDASKVAAETCEVELSPCLVDYVHRETLGNIGRMIIALDKIETHAKAHGIDKPVTAEMWGERPLYFDQPVFGSRGATAGKGSKRAAGR